MVRQVPFESWLSRQFSIAYDLYLDIRRRVDSLVQAALQRDSPDWRLRNACPACTYKLKGEPMLKFNMLFTMDGNDSLKRILRRGCADESVEEQVGPVIERYDPRTLKTDYYISRDAVDKWAQNVEQEMIPTQAVKVGTTEVSRCPPFSAVNHRMMQMTRTKCLIQTHVLPAGEICLQTSANGCGECSTKLAYFSHYAVMVSRW